MEVFYRDLWYLFGNSTICIQFCDLISIQMLQRH